jgi:hypothetical protein
MEELGFKVGRLADTNYRDYLPMANNFLSGCIPVGYPTTLETVQGQVNTIALEKSIGSFTFHRITEDPNHTNEWGTRDFQTLINYVLSSGLYCLTLLDFYNLQSSSVTVAKPGF